MFDRGSEEMLTINDLQTVISASVENNSEIDEDDDNQDDNNLVYHDDKRDGDYIPPKETETFRNM